MIDWVAVVSSVVVGGVLVLAGALKLADRASWDADAGALGAPAWTVPLVPWFELIAGALLVVQVARRPVSILASLTFVAFTALIVRALAEGRRPVCACFGAWSTRPLGWRHVVRNVTLLGLAVLASL